MTSSQQPRLVGLAGGSGSGKSTLARALATTCDAVILPQDAYYRDLSSLTAAARQHWNFDTPDAFDWERFVADLTELTEGMAVRRPVYDFVSHTRTGDTALVTPTRLVVVEGLLILHDARCRDLFDLSVFLDLDQETALARRVDRDRQQRGRDAAEVRRRFERDVQPMFERWVAPTRRWATLHLSGARPIAELVERIRDALAQSTA